MIFALLVAIIATAASGWLDANGIFLLGDLHIIGVTF